MSDMTRDDLLKRIAQDSAQDPAFRARLLADPKAAIVEITGMPIPDAVTITVHEETLTDIHLVLPSDTSALSEEDLELVSGGWNGGACGGCCACC